MGNSCIKKSRVPSQTQGTVVATPIIHEGEIQVTIPTLATNQHQINHKPDRVLVVAIDFGTTYTGYVYSFRHEYERDPLKFNAALWTHSNGQSTKAPTAVLLTPDTEFKSFGFDALRDYAELAENGNHREYYFFHRFKMNLYTETNLSIGTSLTDAVGKKLPALVVFSRVLRFLKEHFLTRLKSRDTAMNIDERSIHWVVTIPAIWNDKAKQFMRRATQQIGIPSDQLTLALEPEAASLVCRCIPVGEQGGETAGKFVSFKTGTKYMIVDLGGGTVDVSVHAVQQNGTLQEVSPPSGGFWGGTVVDQEFQAILCRVVGQEVYDKLNLEYAQDILDFLGSFELKKKDFNPNHAGDVRLPLPPCVKEVYHQVTDNDLCDALSLSEYADEISIKRGKLILSKALFESLFHPSLTHITGHLIHLIESGPAKGIDTIILVGGYADSEMVRSHISNTFPSIRILRPEDASLAVVKGAVLFGHEPHAISGRVSKRTYGMAIQTGFNPTKHPTEKRIIIGDQQFCDDVFDSHLQIGEIVRVDQKRPAKSYTIPAGSKYAVLDVYVSTDKNPQFVTEISCAKLGTIVIERCSDQTDATQTSGLSEEIYVSLTYSGTELAVLAVKKKTGKRTTAYFDFLG